MGGGGVFMISLIDQKLPSLYRTVIRWRNKIEDI